MADHNGLLTAAGRIADGEHVDWASITSTLPSDEDRALAEELAVVAQIAAGHRQLHQLLPVAVDTPPNLMPDRARWGHLDLLNIVGRGSYGTVYRAWDTRLERLVALKLFHGASNPDAVMQEGRMLARVRHENVVTVFGADVIDGVAGIWMELVHGRTLDHIVKDSGALGAREAAAVGVDIAKALAAVHAAGLLHCDVKAQNVVRESGGRVVLMDLGAGRVVPDAQDGDQLSDVAGTPRYMAPELFKTGASATTATDIYSFGVLLYFLVSGRVPVDGKTLGELKHAHAAGQTQALGEICPDAPKPFVDAVSKALDRDPAQRPESVAEMQSLLAPVASEPVAAPAPRSIGWWALAAAGAVVVTVLMLRPMLTPPAPPAPSIRSIAVLPIKNLTGDPAKAYVAEGLSQVLIANLARIRSVRVPSFESVSVVADQSAPRKAGQQLGVQLLLAGSVTQLDTHIRLTVHLTDVQSGNVLWGEELTRELGAMLSAQAEIARMVASRLALELSPAEQRALTLASLQPQAQDAFLRGLALDAQGPARATEAGRAFREAVELEPSFAAGWAELALQESRMIERSPATERAARAQSVRQLAQRALALDDSLATGLVALGSVDFYNDWNFAAAAQTLGKALEVSPSNALARQRLAMLMSALGRHNDAIALGREAVALEPMVARRAAVLGIAYYYARDYPNALRATEQGLAAMPGNAIAHLGLGRIYSAMGEHSRAIDHLQAAVAGSRTSGYLIELARVYAAAGQAAEKENILREVFAREQAGEAFSQDNLAYIAAAEGRNDDAFKILDEAIQHRLSNVLWIAVDPRVDPLRTDPRFPRLLVKAGLKPPEA